MYRQTRLLGVLLILQVGAMVGIGVWLFSRIDWDRVKVLANEPGQIRVQTIDGALYFIYFLPPAILLLLAGLGFVLLRRRGWMLASVAQALIMLACLFFYGDSRPWFAYPLIACSIFMILLLNSRSVRAAVHRKRTALADARPEVAHGE